MSDELYKKICWDISVKYQRNTKSWRAAIKEACEVYESAKQQCDVCLLDPDMPSQELKLHMGELTATEERTARAAIRWANTNKAKQERL